MAAVGVLEANITAAIHTSHNKNRRAVRMGHARRVTALPSGSHPMPTAHGRIYVPAVGTYWPVCVCPVALGTHGGEQRATSSEQQQRPRPPPRDQPLDRCRREAEAPEIHARGRSTEHWLGGGEVR